MFTKDEATKERVGAYVVALEREQDGYERRIAALTAGKHDPLNEEQLKARIDAVGAELKRAKSLRGRKSENA